MIASIYKKIVDNNKKKLIFHPGPHNFCGDSKRIYLDELKVTIDNAYQTLSKYVIKLIEPILGNSYYICLVTYSEEKLNTFPEEKLKQLNNCYINFPFDFAFDVDYDDEDEWYINFLFFKEKGENLEKYVNGILATSLSDFEPFINMEVFFIDNELKTLINLYDDRGMDIVKLK